MVKGNPTKYDKQEKEILYPPPLPSCSPAPDAHTHKIQSAFAEVVGLCQGFTAGDMCAVAAGALDLWAASAGLQARGNGGGGGSGVQRRMGVMQPLSRGEALRAAFRQVCSVYCTVGLFFSMLSASYPVAPSSSFLHTVAPSSCQRLFVLVSLSCVWRNVRENAETAVGCCGWMGLNEPDPQMQLRWQGRQEAASGTRENGSSRIDANRVPFRSDLMSMFRPSSPPSIQ